MADHNKNAATQAAINLENQAAAKEVEPKGLVAKLYEAAGELYEAGREVVQSVRHEAELMFWGRDSYHSGNIEIVNEKQLSFDDLMAQRAEMMPPPEQEQAPSTIDR